MKLVPFYFILGFSLGILYIYSTYTPARIIWHHPTPENAGKVIYEDKDNKCYKYLAEEVKCPGAGDIDHPVIIGS